MTSAFTVARSYHYELEGLTYIIECADGQWAIYMPEGLGYPPIIDLRVFEFGPKLLKGREFTLQDAKDILHEVLMRVPRSHKQFGVGSLAEPERAVLQRSVRLVERVATLPEVKIVQFTSPDIHGMYSYGCQEPDCGCDARPTCAWRPYISLARHILGDQKQTLKVLVHEVAHKAGGDGSHAHLMEMQRLWSELVIEMSSTES